MNFTERGTSIRQGTGSQILKNFYSFLYFQDKEQNKFYKRFVRDYMRYQDDPMRRP